MQKNLLFLTCFGMLAGLSPTLRADVWDSSGDGTASNTENELVHRTVQVHDLQASGGVADVDWYRITANPHSSYEVIVDQTTADVTPITLNRYDSVGGGLPLVSTGTSSLGYTRTLRFENTTGSAVDYTVKVQSGGSCTTACTASAGYRIRAFDTTYAAGRYYEHPTISTTVLIENPNDYSATVHVYYWRGNTASGTLLDTATTTVPVRGLKLVSTPMNAVGFAGFVTVSSAAGYGDLEGKASQYDTDTGIGTPAFDHMMFPRR